MDYSNDGIMMLPPGADAFGRGVVHYVRALALASAASHEQGTAEWVPQVLAGLCFLLQHHLYEENHKAAAADSAATSTTDQLHSNKCHLSDVAFCPL